MVAVKFDFFVLRPLSFVFCLFSRLRRAGDKGRRAKDIICAFLCLCSFSYSASAHKFYVSTSQIEYNQQEKNAEIIIRIFADDLENALGKRAGRSVKIGQTEDFDKLALAYLRDTFELRNRSGQIVKLNWVGKEVQTDMVWIYVEAKMPEGLSGAQLRNRILFEMFSEQVNIVNTKFNGKQTGLMYQQGDKFKSITERPPASGTPRG
jgi:hypothetical protein